MKFRYEHMSLTQIGEVFGTTSHQVGRWLAKIGLRYQSKHGWKPSREAHAGGFVKDVGTGGLNYIWAWHTERTIKALEDAGHKVVIQPGHELLAPCRLNGPFQCRPNPQFGHEVVNGDGSVAVCVTGEENARFVTSLLNLADKHGIVRRVLGDKEDGTNEACVVIPATKGEAG
jgi:hypothetical protein